MNTCSLCGSRLPAQAYLCRRCGLLTRAGARVLAANAWGAPTLDQLTAALDCRDDEDAREERAENDYYAGNGDESTGY